MSKDDLKGLLAKLETLGQEDSSEDIYDSWSETYDADLLDNWGYNAPQRAVKAFVERFSEKSALVVDYGCGTGLVGEELAKAGFQNITGYDYSEGMLEIARQKKVYERLIQADLTLPIEVGEQYYDGMVCVGSYAPGHLLPHHTAGMVETIKSGGVIVIYLNEAPYLEFNFPAECKRMEERNLWRVELDERSNYMDSIERPGHLIVAHRV